MFREAVMSVSFDPKVLKHVEAEVRNIKHDFRGLVPEESIDALASESLARLAGSKVPQFVPLFVGRFTRQRLREQIRAGAIAVTEPEIEA
ncbi:MAG: hypothetical protein AUI15_16725 [Actinobacteria bacterium 13_2_20CM_2_66_6]|nr:MAG: hypothetical protein AUI15_16725 [Actinobacteria bacterium 13_2_20CM_2_66_6]